MLVRLLFLVTCKERTSSKRHDLYIYTFKHNTKARAKKKRIEVDEVTSSTVQIR